ncbi:MAG: NADH-quinone oxidoreductase subunit C [Candidatus Rokubacteria bacterium]|nr:NADH-quinone oxidoreductase subunit C [Candidatus Rokubacteria bacterium]
MSTTPAAATARIREQFGVEATAEAATLTVAVPRERWLALARFARRELGCLYFNWLSAVDWKEQGFEVLCRVENLEAGLVLMMRTPPADPPVRGLGGPPAAQGLRPRHAPRAVPMTRRGRSRR